MSTTEQYDDQSSEQYSEQYDVFNGDADGMCALHQYRLVHPAEAHVVTGVKRDIQLLKRLKEVRNAQILVLDVSFDKNRDEVVGLLERGCSVRYFDHHFAGDIPEHDRLNVHIDPSPKVCTSLLMDRFLGGVHRAWAVTAAFGDNLADSALEAAKSLNLSEQDLKDLRTLGELLNYNAYGQTLDDLHFEPAELYESIQSYVDPLEFIRNASEAHALRSGHARDMGKAEGLEPILDGAAGRVFHFPGEKWARRVMGVYANRIANDDRDRATATVVDGSDGTVRISVRAPKNRPSGADTLCRQFPSGGGRAGAAGVNDLPMADLSRFLEAFERAFSR